MDQRGEAEGQVDLRFGHPRLGHAMGLWRCFLALVVAEASVLPAHPAAQVQNWKRRLQGWLWNPQINQQDVYRKNTLSCFSVLFCVFFFWGGGGLKAAVSSNLLGVSGFFWGVPNLFGGVKGKAPVKPTFWKKTLKDEPPPLGQRAHLVKRSQCIFKIERREPREVQPLYAQPILTGITLFRVGLKGNHKNNRHFDPRLTNPCLFIWGNPLRSGWWI